jgi:tetratricopeptide (TPR) repeat protein
MVAVHEILASADFLFWGNLLTYYGEALVYVGTFESQVQLILDQGIRLLKSLKLHQDESLSWLKNKTLGRAFNTLGYLSRSHGHYGDALAAYQNALDSFNNTDILDEKADTLNNVAFTLALLGISERSITYANQALVSRQQLGQNYPVALSHNTRGIIYSLQGQHELGQRESQLALNIFEELESPRGIGLACNALGYIFRKQGEGWKLTQSTSSDAIFCFRQSSKYLERAEKVFSGEVSEPIRLWEAFNEQGSLYREWGLLQHEQQEIEAAQELYAKAVECQLKALEIARKYRMRFQEADTYDDLAKVLWDQGDTKKARYWLKRALSLVPKDYPAPSDGKNRKLPPAGEAYWLILGKVYFQEGSWAFKSLTKGILSKGKHQRYTQAVIKNFSLAAHYFERYWPGTSANRSRFQFMADQIVQLGMPVREIRRAIKLEGTRHKLNVSAFLRMFPSRSIRR